MGLGGMRAAAVALTLCVSMNMATPAAAQAAKDEWTFVVTPYAWLMGASGNVTAKGQTIDVNASVVDMFAKTDTLVALMANMEARRDKWAFGLDFIFTQMTATPSFATQRNPVPWLNFTAAAGANDRAAALSVAMTRDCFGRTDPTPRGHFG